MKFPDKEWLTSICQIGKGNRCCRYLTCGFKGWKCAKMTDLKSEIDKRVAAGQFSAKGDNCDGPNAPQRILN